MVKLLARFRLMTDTVDHTVDLSDRHFAVDPHAAALTATYIQIKSLLLVSISYFHSAITSDGFRVLKTRWRISGLGPYPTSRSGAEPLTELGG